MPSHQNVKRTTWGIASPVEYDVPKCADGVAGCSRGADGTWVHTIRGTYEAWVGAGTQGKLVAAHFHCHAPTCLSISLYSCAPNSTTTCLDKRLMCREAPLYGGTGSLDLKRFDEPGYIAIPDCFWGDARWGLEPPPDLTGYPLHVSRATALPPAAVPRGRV